MKTLAIATESFRLLRRDRIFVPAAIAGAMIAGLANLASEWSIADFSKILVDVGGFGFMLTGSAVAMFWGVKVVSDAREGGALEVQLAAPVSRTQWIIGKYLGLAACLSFLALLMLAIWQALMLSNGFGWVDRAQVAMFIAMLTSWMVTGALAMLLASVASMGVAMFAAAGFWLVGQSSALIFATLAPDSAPQTRWVVGAIARFWDLQQFNLVNAASTGQLPETAELVSRGAYGVVLLLALVSIAALGFTRRDLV